MSSSISAVHRQFETDLLGERRLPIFAFRLLIVGEQFLHGAVIGFEQCDGIRSLAGWHDWLLLKPNNGALADQFQYQRRFCGNEKSIRSRARQPYHRTCSGIANATTAVPINGNGSSSQLGTAGLLDAFVPGPPRPWRFPDSRRAASSRPRHSVKFLAVRTVVEHNWNIFVLSVCYTTLAFQNETCTVAPTGSPFRGEAASWNKEETVMKEAAFAGGRQGGEVPSASGRWTPR